MIRRRLTGLTLALLNAACGAGTPPPGNPHGGTPAGAGGMTAAGAPAAAGSAGTASPFGGAGAAAAGRGGMPGQPGGLGGVGGVASGASGIGGAAAGAGGIGGASVGAGGCAGVAGCVSRCVAKCVNNPYAEPMSFADVRFGVAPVLTSGDLVHLGHLPVALTLSVGTIPEDRRTRFGLTVGYVSAGVDLDAAAKTLNRQSRAQVEASNPFQIFEVGALGKQYLCGHGNWWGGLGFAMGMAWFSGVKIRYTDGAAGGYDVDRSTRVFGRLIFEGALGARGDGGPHLSIEPTIYSSFADPLQLLLPIAAGYEF